MRKERLINCEWKFIFGKYRLGMQFSDENWSDVRLIFT